MVAGDFAKSKNWSFIKIRGTLFITKFIQQRVNLMPYKPKILAFSGSLREKSYNKKVLKVAVEGAKKAGADVTYIDLKDYPMPLYNPDLQETQGFPPIAAALQKLLHEHDGLLIASPEYNASVTGVLKNAIDWTSRANGDFKLGECYKGKFAAIMTASPGAFGGLRCLGHLRDILTILLVNVLPTEIAVAKVGGIFDIDTDEMTNDNMRMILEDLGKSLADMLGKTHGEVEIVKSAASDTGGGGASR